MSANEPPSGSSSSMNTCGLNKNYPLKSYPKDAQVIIGMMNEFGITEYDPRCVNQLLDFCYGYTTKILERARMYSIHAKKKNIDRDDVKLAIEMLSERTFAKPPSQEFLADMAKKINSQPLPAAKNVAGLRLPPDRHCLLQPDLKLKETKKAAFKKPFYPPPSLSSSGFSFQIKNFPTGLSGPKHTGQTNFPTRFNQSAMLQKMTTNVRRSSNYRNLTFNDNASDKMEYDEDE